MGAVYAETFLQRQTAKCGSNQRLSSVYIVNFVSGLVGCAGSKGR